MKRGKSIMQDVYAFFRENFKGILDHPIVATLGAFTGVMLPIVIEPGLGLTLLVAVDTFTGRQAAYKRGEAVLSGKMRQMTISKVNGYLVFITMAAVASFVMKSDVMLRGAFGLAAAVEFFSITENLYDMGLIRFDPRRVPLFKGIVDAIKHKGKKDE